MPEATDTPRSLADLAANGGDGGSVPIELVEVTKRYGSAGEAAVDRLTMTIPAGEIVVFLGPSGCGKTTTMRMINRLIEPTSGHILIGGRDAREQRPDELRRHIGYVIQQAGLFPHMTVAGNISQVPQMLGWSRERISARIDELLELVGMNPAEFRDRYPRQLSGGQQQRVGVARALAADPPVLLMDEPFGALDPITRENLQDELLRLQKELSKTIVFVTHDVDEALKIGDRIAILDTGSTIVQYATAEEILANPADSYVEQFIGGETSMRLLKLTRVADVALDDAVQVGAHDDIADVRRRLQDQGADWAIVLDEQDRPLRWANLDSLPAGAGEVRQVIDTGEDGIGTVISGASTLQEAVEALLNADEEVVPVVGDGGAYVGSVALSTVRQAIFEIKGRERELRSRRIAAGRSPVSLSADPVPAADTAPRDAEAAVGEPAGGERS